MSFIEVTSGKVVGNGENKHWKERIIKIDTTGREDRAYAICKICTNNGYPGCLDKCPNLSKNNK